MWSDVKSIMDLRAFTCLWGMYVCVRACRNEWLAGCLLWALGVVRPTMCGIFVGVYIVHTFDFVHAAEVALFTVTVHWCVYAY